jgi:hypothetical protein
MEIWILNRMGYKNPYASFHPQSLGQIDVSDTSLKRSLQHAQKNGHHRRLTHETQKISKT